jgi:hypothetical protein
MRCQWAIAVGLAGLLAGCGGSEEDSYSLVPVTGTVTLDGKPLEGVTISFIAAEDNKPRTDGNDQTGAGGTFAAKYRNRPGLAPGKYKVTVSEPVRPGSAAAKIPEEMRDDPQMLEIARQSAKMVGGSSKAVPPPWPYESPTKTPLSQEVGPKGEKGLVFDLKSTVK